LSTSIHIYLHHTSYRLIIQIVAKQLHGNKQENNVAKFINYETTSISVIQKTIVPLFSSIQVSVDSIQSN